MRREASTSSSVRQILILLRQNLSAMTGGMEPNTDFNGQPDHTIKPKGENHKCTSQSWTPMNDTHEVRFHC